MYFVQLRIARDKHADLRGVKMREVTGLPAHDLAFDPDVEPVGDKRFRASSGWLDRTMTRWRSCRTWTARHPVQSRATSSLTLRRSRSARRASSPRRETNRRTQPTTPGAFMGPTLWTSDAAVFDAGVESHYDMLHNSPNGAGMAWEATTSGCSTARNAHRYNFAEDHGPAGTDHSDGVVARWVKDEVAYVPDVSVRTSWSTANACLSPTPATSAWRCSTSPPAHRRRRRAQFRRRPAVPGQWPGADHGDGRDWRVRGAVRPGAGRWAPLRLRRAAGRISAFTLDIVDYLDLGAGASAAGMALPGPMATCGSRTPG
jgi:hypothetical protein